jgi:hypothetical protein
MNNYQMTARVIILAELIGFKEQTTAQGVV